MNADNPGRMENRERRQTERVMVVIPVRVLAFGSSGGSFTEDTSTVEINRAGARIALKHRVAPGDDLRLINLENFAEADFRVVGPTRLDCGQVAEWGVECAERGRNIWGIDFPAPIGPEESHASALLVCQGCKREVLSVLSLMEVQMLEATGSLYRLCDQCGQLTSWVHANIIRQPRSPESTAEPSPAPAAEPSPPPEPYPVAQPGGVERRAHKRLPIKLRILIRTYKGQEETSKTENVSKGGFAVALGSMLAVGEIVRVVCPYTAGAQDLVQKAEVRRRAVLTPGERWLYGMRYVR